jgi:poly-gamma-glutamate synthase PgsB/CapB
LTTAALSALAAYFFLESVRLQRNRRRLALRIGITGARGKSGVTRLLTAVLRLGGLRVYAKTTGSRAVLLPPDGSEIEIRRRGRPSVLEQVGLLRLAARESAEALVAEMMSFRPELLRIESLGLIRPHILIVTNSRPDHVEHWGPDRESAAGCLAAAVPQGGTVFMPEEELMPVWQETARRRQASLVLTAAAPSRGGSSPGGRNDRERPLRSGFIFDSDVRLVEAVGLHLGLERETIARGLLNALPDLGALKAWRWRPESCGPAWDLVNAFAANDPDSTRLVLDVLRERRWAAGRPLLAVLNLRRDRGDRTTQWLAAFRDGRFPEIHRLYVCGDSIAAFRRRWPEPAGGLEPIGLPSRSASAIMAVLAEKSPRGGLIVGMGNMSGAGRRLVEFWEREAVPHVL